MLRVLVVDDEAPARRRLCRMLEAMPEVEVIGEAADGEAAASAAHRLNPDVMVLDISMPRLDGLALAERVTGLPPIIFCTAHAEHALKAFEVNAVDYLMKPVRPDRLAQALAKVSRAVNGPRLPAPKGERVISTSRGLLRFFEVGPITRFWSDQKYTGFLVDGVEELTEESLSSLESRLGLDFIRAGRSELVRVSAVKAMHSAGEGVTLELNDGQRVAVSRRSVATVKEALLHLHRSPPES
jgi:DNA-binding LytR/AlgR family response regulator